MNPIVKQILAYLTTSRKTVEEVVEKISAKAKASGKSFKEYVQDDANVAHISTVVYDALPFPLRMALKSEKFNTSFIKNFTYVREKLFSVSAQATVNQTPSSASTEKPIETSVAPETPTPEPKSRATRKAPAKKVATVDKTAKAAPKKTVSKNAAPEPVTAAAKKPATKRVAKATTSKGTPTKANEAAPIKRGARKP